MSTGSPKRIAWSLWIPVILAFLLIIAVWSVIIKIAHEHPVESVPLETETGSATHD